MRLRTTAVSIALAVSFGLTPLAAQGAPGGRQHGGGRRGGGEGSMAAPKVIDPVILDGPPTPGTMKQIAELTEAQEPRYDSLYQGFIALTEPQRDSAQAARQAVRTDWENHDREGAKQQGAVLEALVKDLERQQKTFDNQLKDVLTKEQRKDYDQWRDDQRKWAEDQQQKEMERRGGGERPPPRNPSRRAPVHSAFPWAYLSAADCDCGG